jgi:hypothetical protein
MALCVLVLAGGALSSSAVGRSRPSGNHLEVAAHVFGQRYCELLLVHNTAGGFAAAVFNTYGLNRCPQAAWDTIDTTAVAKANNALIAVRNGPRYWAMTRIEKHQGGSQVIENLGGLRMIEEAVISLPTLSTTPYTVHHVDRATTFIWNAGQTVYELRGADGSKWVMQSWSQQIDPTLVRTDLARLDSRLKLPRGWSYRTRRLTKSLRVITVRTAAQVLQDDLGNTYSRLPTRP